MISPDFDAVETTAGEAPDQEPAKPADVSAVRRPFESLYREHFAFVWRMLRRFGVWTSALEDASQEVFVVVHRRYDDFRPGSSERAWLFAIAQRVASDQRRSRRRKGGLLPLSDGVPSRAPDPFDATARAEASELVSAFLDTLDEVQRGVFVLTDLEQMTAREVAEITDANINTVCARVAATRKLFVAFVEKRRLADQGGVR